MKRFTMLKTISVLFLFFSGISAHKFPLITGFFCAYFSLGARFSCTCDLRKEWTALGTSAGATMMKNEEMLWEFRTFWAFFFSDGEQITTQQSLFCLENKPSSPRTLSKTCWSLVAFVEFPLQSLSPSCFSALCEWDYPSTARGLFLCGCVVS